jgi:hypothetical protein
MELRGHEGRWLTFDDSRPRLPLHHNRYAARDYAAAERSKSVIAVASWCESACFLSVSAYILFSPSSAQARPRLSLNRAAVRTPSRKPRAEARAHPAQNLAGVGPRQGTVMVLYSGKTRGISVYNRTIAASEAGCSAEEIDLRRDRVNHE